MVKNNQFRHNIDEMTNMARTSRVVDINWCNKNRVPNPGTWFTTKELAYGGVSRDPFTLVKSVIKYSIQTMKMYKCLMGKQNKTGN